MAIQEIILFVVASSIDIFMQHVKGDLVLFF